jgi:DNA-binding Lrp family transcriptional regulator
MEDSVLDEIDREIICQLQNDARTTLEEIAKVTGFTSVGVKKRLKKLLDEGAIKNQALINPMLFGLIPAIIFLEVSDGDSLKNILKRFSQCPRVVHIFQTVGGFNLIALVVAEDKDTLESVSVEKCSIRSSPGIRRSEFYQVSENDYSQFLQIKEYLMHQKKDKTPCNVDCIACERYKKKKCVGCPSTIHYRGTL